MQVAPHPQGTGLTTARDKVTQVPTSPAQRDQQGHSYQDQLVLR